jgi:hypothetical protein
MDAIHISKEKTSPITHEINVIAERLSFLALEAIMEFAYSSSSGKNTGAAEEKLCLLAVQCAETAGKTVDVLDNEGKEFYIKEELLLKLRELQRSIAAIRAAAAGISKASEVYSGKAIVNSEGSQTSKSTSKHAAGVLLSA